MGRSCRCSQLACCTLTIALAATAAAGGKTEDFLSAAKLLHRAKRQVKVPTYLVPATQKVSMLWCSLMSVDTSAGVCCNACTLLLFACAGLVTAGILWYCSLCVDEGIDSQQKPPDTCICVDMAV